ncbi:M23 family metallopeptidase [Leptothoe spongobia]|uniref:M23 family metallopeptidase n=1 Tax=Leptothoe spongobia TAU-MAC 1115 TaxID=1967444 RepID=A0A947DEX0_9CYAN|nr:M23 family metallopeptidase [Leptothoe spongobia]MBT9315782.1 M23 family metallopeptidase [Leptothoe spongobia TAU-MAC 1115]
MRSKLLKILIAIAIIITFNLPNPKPASAQTTNTWDAMTWPLCGRIKEELGNAWDDGSTGTTCDYSQRIDTDGKTDFPIHHGFGYRNFNTTSRAVSFHRGIDLATPDNNGDNPVFAVADGYVKSITQKSSRDRKITLLHPANGATHCSNTNPCRISIYNHVSNVQIAATDQNGQPTQVTKGQHIAWTGTSQAGDFDHLHFEIRDPYVRASAAGRNTSGRFSYAKDARNPMFYLPYAKLTGADPLAVEIAETPNLDDSDVWVNLTADAGYNFNLKSVTLKAYDGTVGSTERTYTDQSSTQGTYVAAYEVNNNEFVVDDWSMQHTSFPTSSSRWNTEKDENPYFIGTNPTGPDFFLEQNAGTTFTNGHRYADFDHKLITATPHPSSSSDSSWYQLNIGFTGIEPASPGNQRCYEAEVVTHHPEDGDQVKTVERCFM